MTEFDDETEPLDDAINWHLTTALHRLDVKIARLLDMPTPQRPRKPGGRAVVVGVHLITVPLTDEQQRAVDDALYRAEIGAVITQALKPFNLHARDIPIPRFERLVRTNELERRMREMTDA